MSSVTGQAHGIAAFQSSCRSAAENAATTPSAFRAASRSTLFTRACAYGLRTTTMLTVPVGAMLSTYVPCPVRSDASSRRLTGEPT